MQDNANTTEILITEPTPEKPDSALSYLERALTKLRRLNFLEKPQEGQPVVTLLSEPASDKDNELGAVIIARTLQHAGTFNEAVRSQVADMSTGDRYAEITSQFDSIVSDSQNAIVRIENNKEGIREKIAVWYMKFRRGSIHSRFEKIRKVYLDVASDTAAQLARENTILEAYLDYRGALAYANISAEEILEKQVEKLETARLFLLEKTEAMPAAGDNRAQAELARDEALRAYDLQVRREQLVRTIVRFTKKRWYSSPRTKA